ncbi:MAG TPA: RNA polymerase sigma factor [Candidatus Limnocylindria bacterium]
MDRTESAFTGPIAARLDWRRLYEAHAGELLRYLRKLVGDDERASELMQDTFIRAMDRELSLREPADVRPWLYRIATNLAIEHLRRRKRIAFLPFARDHAAGGDVADPTADHVRRTLGSINALQAATLVLCLHEGFTRREVAGLMKVSEETVKSRLARGRAAFAEAYRWLER